jgi:hypothetical protein
MAPLGKSASGSASICSGPSFLSAPDFMTTSSFLAQPGASASALARRPAMLALKKKRAIKRAPP